MIELSQPITGETKQEYIGRMVRDNYGKSPVHKIVAEAAAHFDKVK